MVIVSHLLPRCIFFLVPVCWCFFCIIFRLWVFFEKRNHLFCTNYFLNWFFEKWYINIHSPLLYLACIFLSHLDTFKIWILEIYYFIFLKYGMSSSHPFLQQPLIFNIGKCHDSPSTPPFQTTAWLGQAGFIGWLEQGQQTGLRPTLHNRLPTLYCQCSG